MRYIDTRELKIERQGVHELSVGENPQFGYVLKGSVRVTLESGSRRTSTVAGYGEVFLAPPSTRCTVQNSDKQPTHLALIRFRYADDAPGFDGAGASVGPCGDLRLLCIRMPRISGWIRELTAVDATEGRHTSGYYQAQSHLYAIAAEFAASCAKPAHADDLTNYVLQVKQNMQEDFQATFDIEELARLSGVSAARFYREFKRQTGQSPLQYMIAVRLNEALRLLSSTDSSVTEVAHAVGYPDELYFSRLFKKNMGLSPTEYAALTRTRVANLSPVFRGDLSVLGINPVLQLKREWFNEPDVDPYIEQIEMCRPDIMFTSPVSDEIYANLTQISPVVMINWKGYSWKERLLQISGTLGLTTVAERWLASFGQKVDNARLLLRRHLADKPFLVVSVYNVPFYRVYGMRRIKIRDLFYDELQLTPPEAIRDIYFHDVTSFEEVAALDCNNVLFLVPETVPEERCHQLEEDWLRLKRNRRKKHCIIIRHEDPLLYNAKFYEELIDQLVQYLTTAR